MLSATDLGLDQLAQTVELGSLHLLAGGCCYSRQRLRVIAMAENSTCHMQVIFSCDWGALVF